MDGQLTTMTLADDAMLRGQCGAAAGHVRIAVLCGVNPRAGKTRSEFQAGPPASKRAKQECDGPVALTANQRQAVQSMYALLSRRSQETICLQAAMGGERAALRRLANSLVVVGRDARTCTHTIHGGRLCPPAACACGKTNLKHVTIVAVTASAARCASHAVVLGSTCVSFFKFKGNENSSLCTSLLKRNRGYTCGLAASNPYSHPKIDGYRATFVNERAIHIPTRK